ncbi:hypothetical protein LINGRAHAP2_LOCUS23846, partial [Linum grandiflorum]
MVERDRERAEDWSRVGRECCVLSLRIQDSTILMHSSDEFAGADFRFSAANIRGSAFVVMAGELLGWLVDVLSVAAAQRWAFPAQCEKEVKGRWIHVGGMRQGWPGLLRALREITHRGETKEGRAAGRSFVDVVKKDIFSEAGESYVVSMEGCRVVKVEIRGVEERKNFLGRCLVLRMEGEVMRKGDWEAFDVWSQKSWGIQIEERIGLSDDLWLLKLPLKSDVERWSNVAVQNGFTQIGLELSCGKFLDCDEAGCSWNSVRVKIQMVGMIPRYIPVSFEGEMFVVQVTVEDGGELVAGWRGTGSEVFIRRQVRVVNPLAPIGTRCDEVGIQLGDSRVGKGADGTEEDLTCAQKRTVLGDGHKEQDVEAYVNSGPIIGMEEKDRLEDDRGVSPKRKVKGVAPDRIGGGVVWVGPCPERKKWAEEGALGKKNEPSMLGVDQLGEAQGGLDMMGRVVEDSLQEAQVLGSLAREDENFFKQLGEVSESEYSEDEKGEEDEEVIADSEEVLERRNDDESRREGDDGCRVDEEEVVQTCLLLTQQMELDVKNSDLDVADIVAQTANDVIAKHNKV